MSHHEMGYIDVDAYPQQTKSYLPRCGIAAIILGLIWSPSEK